MHSTQERKFRPKGDKKSTELEVLLSRTFAEAIITDLYPRSQIDIFVQVLQSDGGEAVAAINAATLAVIDAGVAMRDYVVACAFLPRSRPCIVSLRDACVAEFHV